MFNTDFDIRNVWNIVFISIICGFIIYIYLRNVFRKKHYPRVNSNATQTEPVTIVEYDVYGEPYINGYLAVLYEKPYAEIQPWNYV